MSKKIVCCRKTKIHARPETHLSEKKKSCDDKTSKLAKKLICDSHEAKLGVFKAFKEISGGAPKVDHVFSGQVWNMLLYESKLAHSSHVGIKQLHFRYEPNGRVFIIEL